MAVPGLDRHAVAVHDRARPRDRAARAARARRLHARDGARRRRRRRARRARRGDDLHDEHDVGPHDGGGGGRGGRGRGGSSSTRSAAASAPSSSCAGRAASGFDRARRHRRHADPGEPRARPAPRRALPLRFTADRAPVRPPGRGAARVARRLRPRRLLHGPRALPRARPARGAVRSDEARDPLGAVAGHVGGLRLAEGGLRRPRPRQGRAHRGRREAGGRRGLRRGRSSPTTAAASSTGSPPPSPRSTSVARRRRGGSRCSWTAGSAGARTSPRRWPWGAGRARRPALGVRPRRGGGARRRPGPRDPPHRARSDAAAPRRGRRWPTLDRGVPRPLPEAVARGPARGLRGADLGAPSGETGGNQ